MAKHCVRHCLLLLVALAAGQAAALLVGGWSRIKDLKDAHVKEIAEFAVKEHNKQAKTASKLVSVVKGEMQVVSGVNYRLLLAVAEGGAGTVKKYEAVVWEKSWENFSKLTSFKPVKV